MARRKADSEEPVEKKPFRVYKIKPFKRDGQTLYDLLQNGDWLETFETEEAAAVGMAEWQKYDSLIHGAT